MSLRRDLRDGEKRLGYVMVALTSRRDTSRRSAATSCANNTLWGGGARRSRTPSDKSSSNPCSLPVPPFLLPLWACAMANHARPGHQVRRGYQARERPAESQSGQESGLGERRLVRGARRALMPRGWSAGGEKGGTRTQRDTHGTLPPPPPPLLPTPSPFSPSLPLPHEITPLLAYTQGYPPTPALPSLPPPPLHQKGKIFRGVI